MATMPGSCRCRRCSCWTAMASCAGASCPPISPSRRSRMGSWPRSAPCRLRAEGADMELHQVRYFVTLGRTLNFTRAANECNVTQPALTRAIQKLEEELGGPLLYRERAMTQLTPLGRAMVPHLQAMLTAAETARRLA